MEVGHQWGILQITVGLLGKEGDLPSSACFEAAYTPTAGKATWPAVLLMLTIVPDRCLRMLGRRWRMILRGAKKLVSIWLRASASEISSTAPNRENPALLTSTSIFP